MGERRSGRIERPVKMRSQAVVGDASEETFFLRAQTRAWAILGFMRVPDQERGDLIQEAFLIYLRKRDGIYNPEAWFAGTVRKLGIQYWRHHRREMASSVDVAILDALRDSSHCPQESLELQQDLDRALGEVSDRCRSLLRLRYAGGLSPSEAAESMGYKSCGIHKMLERCLSALARQLCSLGFLSK